MFELLFDFNNNIVCGLSGIEVGTTAYQAEDRGFDSPSGHPAWIHTRLKERLRARTSFNFLRVDVCELVNGKQILKRISNQ